MKFGIKKEMKKNEDAASPVIGVILMVTMIAICSIMLAYFIFNISKENKHDDGNIHLSQIGPGEKIYNFTFLNDFGIEDLQFYWLSMNSNGVIVLDVNRWEKVKNSSGSMITDYYYIPDNVRQVTNIPQLKILENSTPPISHMVDMNDISCDQPTINYGSHYNCTISSSHVSLHASFMPDKEGGLILETRNGTIMMSMINFTGDIVEMGVMRLKD